MSKFEEEANVNLEGEDCESDGIGSMSAVDGSGENGFRTTKFSVIRTCLICLLLLCFTFLGSGKRRRVVEWLNILFPSLNIPLEASDEELRALLFDGTVLCGVEKRQDPSALEVLFLASNHLFFFLKSERWLRVVVRLFMIGWKFGAESVIL